MSFCKKTTHHNYTEDYRKNFATRFGRIHNNYVTFGTFNHDEAQTNYF